MIIFSPLLLAISLNFDTLSTSLSYGMKKILLPKSSMILLTILTSIGTLFSMYIGKLFPSFLGLKLGNIFGAILLGYVGVSFIVEYIKLIEKRYGLDNSYFYESPFNYKNLLINPTLLDSDNSNHIDIKECVKLSFAIIVNNFSISFAAGITGININFSIFFYFIISIMSIYFGYCVSYTFYIKWLKEHYYLISGIILIILSVLEAIL